MSSKPTVSQESGVSYYRASSISLPPYCLAAHRMQYESLPPPPALQAAFQAGFQWEPKVINRTASSLGMEIVKELRGEQYEFVIPIGTRAAIRGHIDAVLQDENGLQHGLEVKALGEDYCNTVRSKGIEGIAMYADQLTCYMAGFPEFGQWYWAYQNKTTPDADPTIISVTTPPSDINILKAKVAMVEAGIRAGKDFRDFEYWKHGSWCSVGYLHPDSDSDNITITNDELLDTLSQTYSDARDEEKIAKQKREVTRQQIMSALGDRGRVDTAQWKVSAAEVVAERFSQSALEEEMGADFVARFKRPSSSVRITVTQRINNA